MHQRYSVILTHPWLLVESALMIVSLSIPFNLVILKHTLVLFKVHFYMAAVRNPYSCIHTVKPVTFDLSSRKSFHLWRRPAASPQYADSVSVPFN